MKKLYRYIKFHLKMTYKNIVRHFGLTFSASVAVAITLILISVFMLITSNLNGFTKNIEQQVTIRASIDTIVKDKQKQQLLQDIKKLDTVKSVKPSTGKEELENYKAEYSEDSSLFDMYEGKANPIRDTFLIEMKKGKDIQQTAKKIADMKGIVSAEYGGESTSGMIATFEKIREGGMLFIIFLVIIAVFLISNKIKMSINWAIKFPMMLEGIFIGLLGSLVPVLLTIFGYQYIHNALGGTFMSNMFVLQKVFPLTLEISEVLVLIGMLVGLVGSFFSTTRYLHWKR